MISQSMKDHIRVYGLDNDKVLKLIDRCDELGHALQLMIESYNALEHRYRYGSEEHGALIEEFEEAITNAAATLEPTELTP